MTRNLRGAVAALAISSLALSGCSIAQLGLGGPGNETVDTSWVTNKTIDIAYGNQSDAQKLDLYFPAATDAAKPLPLLVYIHGGAFKMGDKQGNVLDSVLAGTKRGYAVASVNYRLSSEAKFPAAVQDVKQAVRFLKTNAQKYNIDPNRIVVWGESAGGNLAAMVGTTGDTHDFDTADQPYNTVDSSVAAVIDWFGPIDFLTMDSDFATLNASPAMGATDQADSPESQYIGKQISLDPQTTKKANPATYLSANDPAFFIQHGSADRNVPYLQSQRFSEMIAEAVSAKSVQFELLDGAGHGDGGPVGGKAAFSTEANLQKVFTWIDTQVGKAQSQN